VLAPMVPHECQSGAGQALPMQRPSWQVSPPRHSFPQDPQLAESVFGSTQTPSQTSVLSRSFRTQTLLTSSSHAVQGAWHCPPKQSWPDWQTLPHPRNWRGLKQVMPNVPERRACAVISVPRSAVRERPETPRVPVVDEFLALRDIRVSLCQNAGLLLDVRRRRAIGSTRAGGISLCLVPGARSLSLQSRAQSERAGGERPGRMASDTPGSGFSALSGPPHREMQRHIFAMIPTRAWY
jgi:hypothetical protein